MRKKKQVTSSFVLATEKLTPSRNNIKLLVSYTSKNQHHLSFINDEIPSKLALAFSKSASVLESGQVPHINLKYLDFHLLCVKYIELYSIIYRLISNT